MAVESPSVDVVANADRLNELGRLIVKAVVEWNPEALSQLIIEFNETKTRTRVALMNAPVNSLPDIADQNVRWLLQRVSLGQLLPVEEALSGTRIDTLFDSALTVQEIEELGPELFYSWFSHFEFVEGLYEIGSVVLATGCLPSTLVGFVDEARHCYAFQQYRAVCSLSRTILEIAMRDLVVKTGVLPADFYNRKEVRLNELIDKFCNRCVRGANLRGQLHVIRKEGNASIHGQRPVDKIAARTLLQDTLVALHQAYESAQNG